MPDSQTINMWLSGGQQMPKAISIEVSEADDEGDLSLEIWEDNVSRLLIWMNPDSARRLAIAILEATL